jgi:hypothetical protein
MRNEHGLGLASAGEMTMLYFLQATVRYGAESKQISILQSISPGKRVTDLIADFERTIEASLPNGEILQVHVTQLEKPLLAIAHNKYIVAAIPPQPIELGFSFS